MNLTKIVFLNLLIFSFLVAPISAATSKTLGEKYLKTGAILLHRGMDDNALGYFQKSIDVYPENPLPYLVLGDYYYKQGDNYSKALSFYKIFLRKNSQIVQQYRYDVLKRMADCNRAMALESYKDGKSDEWKNLASGAISDYQKAVAGRFSPKNAEQNSADATLSIALLQYMLGEKQTSAKTVLAIPEESYAASQPLYYYCKGLALLTKHNEVKAIESMSKVTSDSQWYPLAQKQIESIQNSRASRTMIYVLLIFLFLFCLGAFFILVKVINRRRTVPQSLPPEISQPIPTVESETVQFESTREAMTYIIARFISFLNLPTGFGFIPNREQNRLVSVAILGVMCDDLTIELKYSYDDVRRWMSSGRAVPFVYKKERREVSYIRAFPNSHLELEKVQARIGIPLIYDGSFIGIVYLACDDNPKAKREVRINYEKNYQNVMALADKFAVVLKKAIDVQLSMTNHDTGLYNAKYYNNYIAERLKDADKKDQPLSLLIMKLDEYGELVKRYGETSASRLRALSIEGITKMISEDMLLAQLGDAEFSIVMPNKELEDAAKLAENIRNMLLTIKLTYQGDPLTATFAVTSYPKSISVPENLSFQAESALLQSADYGGNIIISVGDTVSVKKLSGHSEELEVPVKETPQQSHKHSLGGFKPISSPLSSGQKLKSVDPNTGLMTRQAMERFLAVEAKNVAKTKNKVGILYVGLDNWSKLRTHIIPESLKKLYDVWKNDKFELPAKLEDNGYIICCHPDSEEQFMQLAEQIKNDSASVSLAGSTVTLSVGAALYPDKISSFKNIVLAARNSMIAAMKSGGNRILLYSEK